MLTSFLITSATILSFLSTLGNIFPGAFAAPAPQAWSPPTSGEYPDPEPCRGNCSWVHDPSIIYEDGVYWRFTTSGNIAISTAHDLKGPWTYQGALLSNGTRIRLRKDQDIWAPSVTKIHDTYYCHYAVSFMGSQHSEIGVATSKSLKPGSWIDHGAIGLSQNPKWNLIDPYWSGIQQFQFRDLDQLVSLGAGSDIEIRNVIQNSTENYAVQEGVIMYKHDKKYYIFFSVGQCCRYEHELMPRGDEYHVVVCRADAIAGPYRDKDGKDCLTESGGTTILASHGDVYAPGGQGVMNDPRTERTVMYYHYVNPNVGYEADQFLFGFNYLEWKDGWPVLVASGH